MNREKQRDNNEELVTKRPQDADEQALDPTTEEAEGSEQDSEQGENEMDEAEPAFPAKRSN